MHYYQNPFHRCLCEHCECEQRNPSWITFNEDTSYLKVARTAHGINRAKETSGRIQFIRLESWLENRDQPVVIQFEGDRYVQLTLCDEDVNRLIDGLSTIRDNRRA